MLSYTQEKNIHLRLKLKKTGLSFPRKREPTTTDLATRFPTVCMGPRLRGDDGLSSGFRFAYPGYEPQHFQFTIGLERSNIDIGAGIWPLRGRKLGKGSKRTPARLGRGS
jgi:hypothetical protein